MNARPRKGRDPSTMIVGGVAVLMVLLIAFLAHEERGRYSAADGALARPGFHREFATAASSRLPRRQLVEGRAAAGSSHCALTAAITVSGRAIPASSIGR